MDAENNTNDFNTHESLNYRESLLQAANKAASLLLNSTTETFDVAFFNAMGAMAEAVKVDRVFIFENHMVGEQLYCTQTYEWSKSAEPQQGKAIVIDILYSDVMPDDWFEKISSGFSIGGIVSQMPPELQQQLMPQGVVSIILIPIFIENIFWGFIGFDDCHNERLFIYEEEEILRSCGLLFANAIGKNKMAKNVLKTTLEMEYQEHLLYAVNQMSILLLSFDEPSFEETLKKGMEIIANAAEVDCIYIWKNQLINNELFCYQLVEWSKQRTDYEDSALFKYEEVVPGWNEILAKGDNINNIVSNLSIIEQNHLSPNGILSILVIPIFIKNKFWGFVGFDDCYKERVFSKKVVTILNSAGLLITNSFIRAEMMKNIKDTSEKLEIALEQATAASTAKGNFLSNMSHEMRTPINAIIGLTSIGLKSLDLERKNVALNKIDNAASHLLGVINDILDMTKIEAGKIELVPVKYNYEKMLQRVQSIIHYHLEEKQQTLVINTPKEFPAYIFGDEQRLAQAITNLLSNAIKFTRANGLIILNTTLTNEGENFFELQIDVIDNGIGIPEENITDLFNPFVQVTSQFKYTQGETGLGLAITKSIVELMKGKIWVDSQIEEGTTFSFTVIVDKVLEEDTIKQTSSNGNMYQEVLKNKSLLIVEDIEINREILLALLEETELVIEYAENGKEAVDMVSKNPQKYDIILMDVQMPVMNGLDATRQIRKIKGNENLPIIALTANVFKDDIDACLAAGMNAHLGKPFDMEKIFEKLKFYLAPLKTTHLLKT